MRVFLSYASEDSELADQVHLALVGAEHDVFFDRDSLSPGGDYHEKIRTAVNQSECFIFLVSPHSLAQGSHALSELKYARQKWPHPKGRVLPVLIHEVSLESIPAYLQAVTVLKPDGNIPAETTLAVSRLQAQGRLITHPTLWAVLVALIGFVAWYALKPSLNGGSTPERPDIEILDTSLERTKTVEAIDNCSHPDCRPGEGFVGLAVNVPPVAAHSITTDWPECRRTHADSGANCAPLAVTLPTDAAITRVVVTYSTNGQPGECAEWTAIQLSDASNHTRCGFNWSG